MALGLFWSLVCLAVYLIALSAHRMGLFNKNSFPVRGRTVLLTGGSQGMGRSVGRLLAQKGASVVIVARNVEKLKEAIASIAAGAIDPETQRFHFISADLINPAESVRVVAEVTEWNHGHPPDIVWCCAGTARPTLFIDTSIEDLRQQIDANYFTSAYTAHATLTAWLKPSALDKTTPTASAAPAPEPRHLIFTASFAALYTFVGYAPYSPAKSALRSLADTLSNEMRLYAGSGVGAAGPPVRVHTVFPATIHSEGLAAENLVKTDLTKKLEGTDAGQTPEEVAAASVAGLERGEDMVTTAWVTRLVLCGVLGGSKRSGLGVLDTLLAWVVSLVIPIVRWDHDRTAWTWGKEHGPSGMKRA